MLERARALLVRKYRAYPQGWPDGIDGLPGSGNEQWYRGHEVEWTEERIEALINAKFVPANSPPVSRPVSRKDYMRELMRKKRAKK